MRPSSTAVVMAALALAACMTEAPAPEGARPAAFDIVENGGGRLVVEAGGRRVAIAPPEDYCVEHGSVRDDGGALFLMIGDCAPGAGSGAVTTLSLTDKAMFGEDRTAALDALAAFLATDAGRESAGMGGAAAAIRILGTRRTEDALYVLVEDAGPRVADAFGPRFWRAFTEVNGRAAIASLGVPGVTEAEDTATLLQLSRIVAAIQKANPAAAPGGAAPSPRPRPVG